MLAFRTIPVAAGIEGKAGAIATAVGAYGPCDAYSGGTQRSGRAADAGPGIMAARR